MASAVLDIRLRIRYSGEPEIERFSVEPPRQKSMNAVVTEGILYYVDQHPAVYRQTDCSPNLMAIQSIRRRQFLKVGVVTVCSYGKFFPHDQLGRLRSGQHSVFTPSADNLFSC
ncbi:hypothetical protein SprV_0100140000 [Sparganum proliferum]